MFFKIWVWKGTKEKNFTDDSFNVITLVVYQIQVEENKIVARRSERPGKTKNDTLERCYSI